LGATCADIKEVKATNSKDSAKQDDEHGGHPPYSPSLAPSDFHILGHLKDALRRRRFVDDDELKHGVREELRGLQQRVSRDSVSRKGEIWVLMTKGTSRRNNFKSVNDVPMRYVKFNVTVLTFPQKNI